jgi:hypothetical protein
MVADSTLDDYLTVIVAKRYDEQDPRIIEFEGGYELTPQYQTEIAAHRMFGPAFLRSLIIYSVFFVVVKILVTLAWLPAALFQFLMGAAILLSCAVIIRHAQNLVFFGLIPIPESPTGEIKYPRSFSYRGSAIGFLGFAALYLLLSLVMVSWFLFGGAIACIATGISHWRLSVRAAKPDQMGGCPP